MATTLAATLTGPTGTPTRYTFHLLPGHDFDDGPADAVLVTAPRYTVGVYRLTRFGPTLGRAWVRAFANAGTATITHW